MKNVIVIGCGAAGMMAAITAARNGNKVTIIDGNSKPGRKLLATGNGRCNFTNLAYDHDNYYQLFYNTAEGFGENVNDTLTEFNNYSLIAFFEELGILAKDINGYVYPNSEQAASIVEVLNAELRRLNVKLIFEQKILDIRCDNGELLCMSEDRTYHADAVIIACGGLASPKHGSDGSLYPAIKRLGHTFTKLSPALTSLKFKGKELSALQGVRVKAEVYLSCEACPYKNVAEKENISKENISKDNCNPIKANAIHRDKGEIIFNKDNIGGIPIMQLSSYFYDDNCKKNKYVFINFFPEFKEEKLFSMISERINGKYSQGKTTYECLTGMLNSKLLDYLLRKAGLNPDKRASSIRPSDINKIVKAFTAMSVEVTGTADFDRAQVMHGGIRFSEVDESLQSLIVPNLYFAGEVLDIDGACGGYNLQWAFTSGHLVGNAI